jgi:hypothetical protein
MRWVGPAFLLHVFATHHCTHTGQVSQLLVSLLRTCNSREMAATLFGAAAATPAQAKHRRTAIGIAVTLAVVLLILGVGLGVGIGELRLVVQLGVKPAHSTAVHVSAQTLMPSHIKWPTYQWPWLD